MLAGMAALSRSSAQLLQRHGKCLQRGGTSRRYTSNPQVYVLIPCASVFKAGLGMIFQQNGDATTIFERALNDRRDFDKSELVDALFFVGAPAGAHSELMNNKHQDLLSSLTKLVFADRPDGQKRVLDMYQKPTKDTLAEE